MEQELPHTFHVWIGFAATENSPKEQSSSSWLLLQSWMLSHEPERDFYRNHC